MPICRCSAQTSKSLKEFYTEVSSEDNSGVGGQQMLILIDMIDQLFVETALWGLTSHYDLVILPKDDWKSDWYVKVLASSFGEYRFEYLLPENKRPWKNAVVIGVATNLAEAKKYLLIAMLESEGWQGNTELKKLAEQYI
ncbi:hypothetical protein EGT74_26600 [Chitinophaga lutea]|uniref:Uncharacterized protein n=2 Tax=Chitinophaga lutea TaxID=2488634 RepID=A0A3N4PEP6_9BACT|nr:hypothetical protein EGT74_26600 [Chitinophaga lutea]